MPVADRIAEIENAVQLYLFVRQAVKIDETDHSVKYRLHIAADLFVQLYFNDQSGTAGLVMICRGQRLYGRDCEAGCWHRHPADDPAHHDSSPEGTIAVSVETFLSEVQDILIAKMLI